MPRPEKPEKKPDKRKEKTEANRALKHQLWDEQAERERRQDALVQGLLDKALSKTHSPNFGFADAMLELDEIKHVALALQQTSVAARCVWYKATLAGLVVQQHAVAVGAPDDFHLRGTIEEGRQRLIERMSERHGMSTKRAQKLIAVIEREMKDFKENGGDDDGVIDGEATDVK